MAQNEKPLLNNPLNNTSNIIVAAIVMMIIGIMILPMPTFLMDVFLVMYDYAILYLFSYYEICYAF